MASAPKTSQVEIRNKQVPPATDLYGDPLPEGAIARLGTVRFRHGAVTSAVAFTPDGKVLASAGQFGDGLCLWDVATGRPLQRFASSGISSMAFSPNGKMLATGDLPQLIDVATGKQIRPFKGAGFTTFESIVFSPDGQTAAGGEWAGSGKAASVVLWNIATGEEHLRLEGHRDGVMAVAYAPDGKSLASGSLDNTVRLWNVETGKEMHVLKGHDKAVFSVAQSPTGKLVASAGRDGSIRLWDTKTGKLQHGMDHEGSAYIVVFSPDGKSLASGGGRHIRIWDVETGKEIRSWLAHAERACSLAFSPNGKVLASTGGWDGAIRLWDPGTGKEIRPSLRTLAWSLRSCSRRMACLCSPWVRTAKSWNGMFQLGGSEADYSLQRSDRPNRSIGPPLISLPVATSSQSV